MFKEVRPVSAVRELYDLFVAPRPHKLGFMALSLTLTGLVIWGFSRDSQYEVPYKREITYVNDWRLDRSDAEIIAQQKIDEQKKQAEAARIAAEKERRRQEWKKIDDSLRSIGF